MPHLVADSKVVQPTSNKNNHIFEVEFLIYKSFFYNTTFFHPSDGMFYFYPDS